MSGCRRVILGLGRWAAMIAITAGWLGAQGTTLVLSSAVVAAGGTATLQLSLHTSSEVLPAALQWTFRVPPTASQVTIGEGPVVSSVGKEVTCAGDATAYRCLTAGMNAETMVDGVVATVTVAMVPGADEAVISLTDVLAVSAAGNEIPVAATGAIITVVEKPPVHKLPRTASQRSLLGK